MSSKRAANSAAAVSPPMAMCKIVLCGTFPGLNHTTLKQHIEQLGGERQLKITADTTHLIATSESYSKPSLKTRAAQALGINIIRVEWLLDSVAANFWKQEVNYLLSSSPAIRTSPLATPLSPAALAAALSSRPKQFGPKKQTASTLVSDADADAGADADAKTYRKKAKTSQSVQYIVPVDEVCPIPNAIVYVDGDGVIWDAALNQTNSVQNNNKFYRLQVIQNGAVYQTWTRWGRVSETGQHSMLGDGSLEGATKKFCQKFKDKTGIHWKDRSMHPLLGKYAYIERSYKVDEESNTDSGGVGVGGVKADDDADLRLPECSLPPRVQSLMELVFNQQYFSATMTQLNYDANKLPLGRLSKATISRGFQALKDISALLDDASLAQSLYQIPPHQATENLSNMYYSVIPHAFGRNRPPIIQSYPQLKLEIELLESLSDMKDAELLMAADSIKLHARIHPADKHYEGLGMKELSPLDRTSNEFAELAAYLLQTCGATHSVHYEIEDIFRIEREGEQYRFNNSVVTSTCPDKRLLWHGSRVTNFGGILSQGLRIAPPEAPVSGYMFGKGIYLADMSSKSANYCCSHNSGGTALLLLCEADLGTPLQELVSSSYSAGDDAKSQGMFATLGQGRTGPLAWKDAGCVHPDLSGVQMPNVATAPGHTNVPNASLLYNEYIVYDVSQVRLRYLYRVKM